MWQAKTWAGASGVIYAHKNGASTRRERCGVGKKGVGSSIVRDHIGRRAVCQVRAENLCGLRGGLERQQVLQAACACQGLGLKHCRQLRRPYGDGKMQRTDKARDRGSFDAGWGGRGSKRAGLGATGGSGALPCCAAWAPGWATGLGGLRRAGHKAFLLGMHSMKQAFRDGAQSGDSSRQCPAMAGRGALLDGASWPPTSPVAQAQQRSWPRCEASSSGSVSWASACSRANTAEKCVSTCPASRPKMDRHSCRSSCEAHRLQASRASRAS